MKTSFEQSASLFGFFHTHFVDNRMNIERNMQFAQVLPANMVRIMLPETMQEYFLVLNGTEATVDQFSNEKVTFSLVFWSSEVLFRLSKGL